MANLPEVERDAILDAPADLERDNDLILVDTGAGVDEGVMTFVSHVDLAVVVVTPEPTSIADAYALIKVLRSGQQPGQPAPNVAPVVNQVSGDARLTPSRSGSPERPSGSLGLNQSCSLGLAKMTRYRPRYSHEVRWWFFSLSVLSPRTSVVPPLPCACRLGAHAGDLDAQAPWRSGTPLGPVMPSGRERSVAES